MNFELILSSSQSVEVEKPYVPRQKKEFSAVISKCHCPWSRWRCFDTFRTVEWYIQFTESRKLVRVPVLFEVQGS